MLMNFSEDFRLPSLPAAAGELIPDQVIYQTFACSAIEVNRRVKAHVRRAPRQDDHPFVDSRSNSLYFDFVKKQIIIRKNEEHRILAGHQWVFSNEIKSINGNPEAGDVIELLRHDEKFLGIGFYNPHSLIAFRLLSRVSEAVTFEFLEQRVQQALQLRKRLYPGAESFRLVHGEADFLPGLVIDKYNEFLSLQTLAVGMDRRLTLICDVLESVFHPKAIIERNESPLRALEQLPLKKGVVRGTLGPTIISEHDVKFKVALLEGQKTGFFLDQRDNRL